MRKYPIGVAAVAVILLGGTCVAWADDASATTPVSPSLAVVLGASGLTASGYVDGTFSWFTHSGAAAPADYSSFLLQQAGVTLAYQPASGFGGLINVIASPFSPYVNDYAPQSNTASTRLYVLQGFVRYATGSLTLIAGKFTTLAGAEVVAPVGNTNVTRSLLFSFEPVTLTGVRATYAVNDKVTLIGGVNNGWFNAGDEGADGPGKTLEWGIGFTPSSVLAWTLQGYYGRDRNLAGVVANLGLLDTVVTWNATPALSFAGSIDWGHQDAATGPHTGAASWVGYAMYVNYSLGDRWRVSVRGESFDDHDGYLSGGGVDTRLAEYTVTLGFAPTKRVELRLEGRHDLGDASTVTTSQGWLEALYKF